MDNQQIRLNKFLASRLGLSRREADDAIAAGKVTVSGKPAVLGAHIDKNDEVCYNKKIVPFETDFLYLAFNKPVGYVCSRRAQGSAQAEAVQGNHRSRRGRNSHGDGDRDSQVPAPHP